MDPNQSYHLDVSLDPLARERRHGDDCGDEPRCAAEGFGVPQGLCAPWYA